MLPGAKKDTQSITPAWQKLQQLLAGVTVREVLHVPGERGVLTEVFRPDWDVQHVGVGQVFQVKLGPGMLSAWHCHMNTTDRLFCGAGLVKIVLFDGRSESATFGRLNEFLVGDPRPTLIVVPPGVWHGVHNIGATDAMVLNLPDRAYEYEDPDHYRLPPDTPEIPYVWL